MNKTVEKFQILLFLLLPTDISHAAGIMMRVQQMKAMKQHPQQEMTREEYLLYEQSQQENGQAQKPQAPAPLTYQQKVDQRNQAIAQAIINDNAHPQPTATQGAGNTPGVSVENVQPVNQEQQKPLLPMDSTEVKDVVDLAEVWKKLDKKSTVWPLLMDDQSKVLTVSEYIDRFRRQGVKISAPAEQYVQMIDQIVKENPDMLNKPFGELVQIVAIVGYDFDNGMNKDDLARQVLGEAGFEANKQRFSQQQ